MTDALLLAIMALSLAAMYLLLKKGFRVPPAPAAKQAGAYEPAQPAAPVKHWSDGGRMLTEVVAESRYHATVRELAGEHGDQGADTRLQAVLAVDPLNPYDDKPVAVFVAGRMTGYLSQKDAQAFRDRQRREELEGQSISCDAAIRGGAVWQNKHLAYAVWVDIELSR
jgi:predicted secreted protein|eukprot:gene30721-37978_t